MSRSTVLTPSEEMDADEAAKKGVRSCVFYTDKIRDEQQFFLCLRLKKKIHIQWFVSKLSATQVSKAIYKHELCHT